MKKLGWKQFLWDLSLYSFWKDGQELFWYVALILLAYAVYPLIYKSLFEYEQGRYKYFVFFLWMASVLVVNAYCKIQYPSAYEKIEIAMCRIPVFLCGCLAGERVYSNRNFCRSAYVASFVLTAISGLICKTKYFPMMGQRYTYLFMGIAICITLSVAFSMINARAKTTCVVLDFMGRMSLELYIVHIALRRLFMSSRFYTENCFAQYCFLMLIAVGIAAMLRYISGALQKAIKWK